MDRIPVTADDVIGVTNDADVGPVAVSYTTGPARILRRPISRDHYTAGQFKFKFSSVQFTLLMNC